MPDISMCQDHLCPSAKRCYRHEATPTPHWQSFADFKRPGGAKKCDAFMEVYSKSVRKRLDIQTGRQDELGV